MENIYGFKNWNLIFWKESIIISIGSVKKLVVENVQAFNIFAWFNYTKYSF